MARSEEVVVTGSFCWPGPTQSPAGINNLSGLLNRLEFLKHGHYEKKKEV